MIFSGIAVKDIYILILILLYNFILILEALITVETLVYMYFYNIFQKINSVRLLNGDLIYKILLFLIVLYFFLDYENNQKYSGSALKPGSVMNTALLYFYTITCYEIIIRR